MDQNRAPIYETLLEYVKTSPRSFHVPGHKRRVYDAEPLLHHWSMGDVTEITGMDDLHAPEEMIKEAEKLAAACFGADNTFFLVGGSTSGNLTMLLAICQPGDVVLVDRHAHKSILHGLMLARAKAVFLPVELDGISGIPVGPTAATVAKAIDQYPDARAIMLTCPNYYGYGPNIDEIASLVQDKSMPLLIDEAHGVHFGFHEKLPPSALQQGANGVVQSAHKMGGGLTMGAFLHLQGNRIDPSKVRQVLSMVQTSSPSYPILASLDAFRRTWATDGQSLIQHGLDVVQVFRTCMQSLPRFVVTDMRQGEASVTERNREHKEDPFKLYIYDRTKELNGYALQERLEQTDCMIEMADPRGVLLIFTYASTVEDAHQLYDAFRAIAGLPGDVQVSPVEMRADTSGKNLVTGQEHAEAYEEDYRTQNEACISDPVDFADWHRTLPTELVLLEQAQGRRIAEMIIPYPPGIPLVCKGETMTEEIWKQAKQLRDAGARFQGVEDAKLKVVRVFTEGNRRNGAKMDERAGIHNF